MSLKITIATTAESWLFPLLAGLQQDLCRDGHEVTIVADANEIVTSDITFLLSYWGIVSADVLARSRNTLVVHESDLPLGRGWSPVTWQVLAGINRIPVCLIEAVERFDEGDIYLTDHMELGGDELLPEIRDEQARVTFKLCRDFVRQYPAILDQRRAQTGSGTVYRRRGPADSKLDPQRTIAEQFNLLRVVDNDAYPAHFELGG
ncbi:methionyl-tRNA formyltransferase-like protein, partial [Rhodopirellula maiorica SM1]